MSERSTIDIVHALDDLLEEERSALLSGNLDTIARLVARKEELIDELSVLDHEEHEGMRALAIKVNRNQQLLEHAMEGIRGVASRLSEMRRLKNTLDTYDAKGTKQEITINRERNLEKRA